MNDKEFKIISDAAELLTKLQEQHPECVEMAYLLWGIHHTNGGFKRERKIMFKNLDEE